MTDTAKVVVNCESLSRWCLPWCLHVHFDRTDCNCTSRCARKFKWRLLGPKNNANRTQKTTAITFLLNSFKIYSLQQAWHVPLLLPWAVEWGKNRSPSLLQEFEHRVWIRPVICGFKHTVHATETGSVCLFNGTEVLGSVPVELEAHIVMDPRSARIFLTAMISPPPISLSGDLRLDPHIAPVCLYWSAC